MNELKSHIEIDKGSNRNFGLVIGSVLIAIGIFFLDGILQKGIAIVGLLLFFSGLFIPKILAPMNEKWFKFGHLLGAIISPVIMGIIFFVIVTPIALSLRILKKELMDQSKTPSLKSYWIDRSQPLGSMKNQF